MPPRYIREAGEHVELDDLIELFETEVEPEAGREIMTLTQKLLAQGRAEGRAEGRMEGRVEGKAGLLLRLLTVRFRTIPDPVRQRVGQATPEELDGWAERILVAATLEEVFGN